jgi:hypothetical protein
MAKVTLPLMSGQARNKVGDLVFFRRGDWGVNVVRMRTIPKNPRTTSQQANRHNVGTLLKIYLGKVNAGGQQLFRFDSSQNVWVLITISSNESFGDTERQAWENFKTISEKGHSVTGKYAFLSVNIKRLKQGLNPLKTPDTEFTLS